MTNAEVLQTMTVKELAKYLSEVDGTVKTEWWELWLRLDSQSDGGLLTDEVKEFWKVH